MWNIYVPHSYVQPSPWLSPGPWSSLSWSGWELYLRLGIGKSLGWGWRLAKGWAVGHVGKLGIGILMGLGSGLLLGMGIGVRQRMEMGQGIAMGFFFYTWRARYLCLPILELSHKNCSFCSATTYLLQETVVFSGFFWIKIVNLFKQKNLHFQIACIFF